MSDTLTIDQQLLEQLRRDFDYTGDIRPYTAPAESPQEPTVSYGESAAEYGARDKDAAYTESVLPPDTEQDANIVAEQSTPTEAVSERDSHEESATELTPVYREETTPPEDSDNAFLNVSFGSSFATLILILLGIVVAFFIARYIMCRRSNRFVLSEEDEPQTAEKPEEDIHSPHFVSLVDVAMKKEDYCEVVRLVYLQTLKVLSDAGKIKWEPFKTYTQYVREMRNSNFTAMTNHFLRVRYGMYEVTADDAREMMHLQVLVLGGNAVANLRKGGRA